MSLEALAPIFILGSYAAFVILDFAAPARSFTKMRWWRLKGFGFFLLGMVINVALPIFWGPALAGLAPVDLTGLGTVGGALVGLLLTTFVAYWYHRAQHRFAWLWRLGHQLHHSAERVDVWGAFLFHPIDTVIVLGLQSIQLALLGLSPDAVALAGIASFFCAVSQHANLRTPRWLGYLIARPEMHSMHHERGVHGYNYSDLPIWDLLFGTFRNPKVWEGQAGFYDGASERTLAMLAFADVSSPDASTPTATSARVGLEIEGSAR
jgi:sterol desaturase/sphingolipid hydroxylase (fatty acid hydroxylase superfamily)